MSEIIGVPLGYIMWLMYQITHNYAWAIILFTLITKIILFPLSVKQQKSSAGRDMGWMREYIQRRDEGV